MKTRSCAAFRRYFISLKIFLAVFAAVLSIGPVFAAPTETLPPAARKEAEKIREAVQANFQACNEENVKALLATCSRQSPGMNEFAKEAKTLFEKTDVYLRLADFELLELRPPHAAARIVQITLPRDEKDRTRGEPKEIFYQERSGLLPKWECCEYTQTFRKEDGKWRLYLITTEPKPVEWNVKEGK
jgi:hypothetical protein